MADRPDLDKIKEESTAVLDRIKEKSTEVVEEDPIVPPANKDGATITAHFPVEQKDRYGASITFKVKAVRGASLEAAGVVENVLKKSEERSKIQEELQEANSKDYDPDKNEGKSQSQAIEEAETKAKNYESNKNNVVDEKIYNPRKTEYRGVNIKLYLPVALQQNDGFNIATPELGQIGAAAAATASQGQGVVAAIGNGIGRAANSIIDLVGGNLAGDAARLASSQLAGRVPVIGSELGTA